MASISAARRSRPSSPTASPAVLGSARRETPRRAARRRSMLELAEALRAALDDAGVEPMGLEGVGVGAPGAIDAASGTVAAGAEHRRLGRAVPARARARRGAGPAGADRQRRQRRGQGRAPLRCGPRLRLPSSASSGARAWAAGSSSTAGSSSGAGRPGRSATSARSPAAGCCNCGLHGCVEAYAGRGALEDAGPRARQGAARPSSSS